MLFFNRKTKEIETITKPRSDFEKILPDHLVSEVDMIASNKYSAIYKKDGYFFYSVQEGQQLYISIYDKITEKDYMNLCREMVDFYMQNHNTFNLTIY